MADSNGLEIAQSRNDTDDHLLQLVLLPVSASTLPLAEQMLQVGAAIHVLADHCDPIGVIHSLVEVVAEELEDIGMALHFE